MAPVSKMNTQETNTFKPCCGPHLGDCSICFDEVEDRGLQCGGCRAGFHVQCVEQWRETGHSSCPVCRHDPVAAEKLKREKQMRILEFFH